MKLIAFEVGVNVTVGLPIIRTSVDHGTAFDIATGAKPSRTACAMPPITLASLLGVDPSARIEEHPMKRLCIFVLYYSAECLHSYKRVLKTAHSWNLENQEQLLHIFARSCAECHDSEISRSPKGGFGEIMQLKVLANNNNYIVKGNADDSELYLCLIGESFFDTMPPKSSDVPQLSGVRYCPRKTVDRKWRTRARNASKQHC